MGFIRRRMTRKLCALMYGTSAREFRLHRYFHTGDSYSDVILHHFRHVLESLAFSMTSAAKSNFLSNELALPLLHAVLTGAAFVCRMVPGLCWTASHLPLIIALASEGSNPDGWSVDCAVARNCFAPRKSTCSPDSNPKGASVYACPSAWLS